MDDELRNGLWNALKIFYFTKIDPPNLSYHNKLNSLFVKLHLDYYKTPLDNLDDYFPNTYKQTITYFYKCKWNEVYDFIEFIANNDFYYGTNQRVRNYCNTILERELSAYRFVNNRIVEITSNEEIKEIECAIKKSPNAIKIHLNKSLKFLSDKKKPDYGNSIKESISAVESICRHITKKHKATLGDAIKELKKHIYIHSALEKSFYSIYGYTSDEDGIRHAIMNEKDISLEDARFMLVSCSTFINYLTIKSDKARIKSDKKNKIVSLFTP